MLFQQQFNTFFERLSIRHDSNDEIAVPSELDFIPEEQEFYAGDRVLVSDHNGEHFGLVVETDGEWCKVWYEDQRWLCTWLRSWRLTLLEVA